MTRMSKQGQRRAVSPRRRKNPSVKTGPKQDQLPGGFKAHENALESQRTVFIAKVKQG